MKNGKNKKSISLRMRLTLLTMTALIAMTGLLVFLVNRNVRMQIVEAEEPLTLIIAEAAMQPLEKAEQTQGGGEYRAEFFPSASFSAEAVELPEKEAQYSITTGGGAEKKEADVIRFKETIDAEKLTVALSNTASGIQKYSVIVFAVLILFGGMVVYVWSGRLLKPVENLSSEMRRRTVDTLNCPIDNENSAAEIKNLADSFNSMLENLNQSFEIQKRFNANAAHELRTPIAVLQTNIEALEEGESGLEDYQEFLAIAKRTVRRMHLLVENLLCMTQTESMEKKDMIFLDGLLQAAAEDAAQLLEEKHITLHTDFTEGLAIWGNEPLFYTAVYNLIENAANYNQDGGCIALRLERQGDNAKITVSDTGIGIPQEALPAIFRPFYRVEQSRARKLGGAGMGLSLVQSIVKNHQGTVCVESVLGEGSAFVLCVPLCSEGDVLVK